MRPKLTYANVMATIAVFIALGGASYAALKLPKNSVSAKQLKKNAVTTAKIKKEAVTAAKVKKGTLTGTQINASTLGTVPSAERANALAAPENWHEVGAPGEPAFQNGWKDQSPTPDASETVGFYKDHEGVVHLKGTATEGTNAAIFALPVGYRPAKPLHFAVSCSCAGESTTSLQIFGSNTPAPDLNGMVYLSTIAPFVSLDGITFRAES